MLYMYIYIYTGIFIAWFGFGTTIAQGHSRACFCLRAPGFWGVWGVGLFVARGQKRPRGFWGLGGGGGGRFLVHIYIYIYMYIYIYILTPPAQAADITGLLSYLRPFGIVPLPPFPSKIFAPFSLLRSIPPFPP